MRMIRRWNFDDRTHLAGGPERGPEFGAWKQWFRLILNEEKKRKAKFARRKARKDRRVREFVQNRIVPLMQDKPDQTSNLRVVLRELDMTEEGQEKRTMLRSTQRRNRPQGRFGKKRSGHGAGGADGLVAHRHGLDGDDARGGLAGIYLDEAVGSVLPQHRSVAELLPVASSRSASVEHARRARLENRPTI